MAAGLLASAAMDGAAAKALRPTDARQIEATLWTVRRPAQPLPLALVRIPDHRERPFRPIVSTDSGDVSSRSGHVSTDSGAPEHRFR